MTITEYQKLALRSIKDHVDKNMALCDWTLGLMGEAAEVLECYTEAMTTYAQGMLWSDDQRMNLAKELGDVLWYSVALCAELNLEMEELDFSNMLRFATKEDAASISGIYECIHLPIMIGGIAEHLKHYTMHNEPLDPDVLTRFFPEIWRDLHLLACHQRFELADVAALNIAKLSHRYDLDQEGQYNDTDSAQRHTKEEQFADTIAYKDIACRIIGGKACE